MSCESNPEVISTPMQQAKRQKYMVRRLGFLYHLIGSSAAICVTIGSEIPWTWGVSSSIGICGAIVKSQAHANSRLVDQVVEIRTPDVRDNYEDRNTGDLGN
jgi:shikimate kinase